MIMIFKSAYHTTIRDILNPVPALSHLGGIALLWVAYFMISSPLFLVSPNPLPFSLYWPSVIGSSLLFLVACSKSYFSILVAIVTAIILALIGYAVEAMAVVILIHVAIIITLPSKSA